MIFHWIIPIKEKCFYTRSGLEPPLDQEPAQVDEVKALRFLGKKK